MNTQVLLVEDHEAVRQELRLLLEQQSGIEVVAEAGDGRTAVALASTCLPDIAVMDVGLPHLNGIEATRQIRVKAPGVNVVALSVHADRRLVDGMFQAGASAYVLKTAATRELVEAIRQVQAGRKFVSPELIALFGEDYGASSF